MNARMSGKTAMHCGAYTGNEEVVKLLLEYHADLEVEVGAEISI